jgi:hypothetical protein
MVGIVLFSAVVIQWITSKDNAGTSSVASSNGEAHGRGHGTSEALAPCALHSTWSNPGNESLAATTESSIKSDSIADEAGGCGGIRVTTTIQRETKLDDGMKACSCGKTSGGNAWDAAAFACEEGRLTVDHPGRK